MIEHLEALAALAREGTMQRAAVELRITQSAVSKRIALLEDKVGVKLIEPVGRRVQLTKEGVRLNEKSLGLLAELRSLLTTDTAPASGRIVIGISESILASWGASLLALVQSHLPDVSFEVHAHRSPVVINRVQAGEYAVGIVAGHCDNAPGLWVQKLMEEHFVVIPKAGEETDLTTAASQLLVIEPRSATWEAIGHKVSKQFEEWEIPLNIVGSLESFTAVTQMVKAGFGSGLVPYGIASAFAIKEQDMIILPEPGFHRPITLICRQKTLSRNLVSLFCKEVQDHIQDFDKIKQPA